MQLQLQNKKMKLGLLHWWKKNLKHWPLLVAASHRMNWHYKGFLSGWLLQLGTHSQRGALSPSTKGFADRLLHERRWVMHTCGRAIDSCLWSDSFSCPSSRRRSWAVPRLSCVSLRFSRSLSLSVSMLTIKDSRFPVLPPSSPPPRGSLPPKPPPPIAPPGPPTPALAGDEGPPPVPLRPSSEMVGITSHIIMRLLCVKHVYGVN